MHIIKVENLKPDMIFSKPLYVDTYNKIIDKEVPLTLTIIEELKSWRIDEILTDGILLEKLDTKRINKDTESKEIVGTYTGYDSKIRTITEINETRQNNERLKKRKKLLEKLKKNDIIPYSEPKKNIIRLYNSIKEIINESIDTIKKRKPLDKSVLINACDRLYTGIINESLEFYKIIFSETQEYTLTKYLINQLIDTTIFSLMMAKLLKLDIKSRNNLAIGSLLHDIGMFIIPHEIIEKNSSLTNEEYEKVKTHPFLGYKVLIQIAKLPKEIAVIALHHQELFNGNGYPRGLKESEINNLARIVSITSVYSSLIHSRTYRENLKPFDAITKMITVIKDKFDPKLLNAFVKTIGLYPPSTYVRLNNDYSGQVIKANPNFPKAPYVQILYDNEGIPASKETILDLSVNEDLFIEKSLTKFEFEKMIVEKHEKL